METFGCRECWPEDANLAWQARRVLVSELVAGSHFDVTISACATCHQRYVVIFTEMINWSGGDDWQESIVLPLTDGEVACLMAAPVDENALNGLGEGRRSLHIDNAIYWSTGLRVGAHD